MAAPGDAPAPLRLPAILQNPVSSAQRQVEAHNAQQRERLAARREREKAARSATSADGKLSGKGRRVIRRYDNATFADNPHIALPRRSDLFPPVPLHHRAARPAFPPSTIPRTASIPATAPPDRNPLSDSSVSGGFSTSLKGVRALLRKGGRRAEVLIPRVEGVLRGWLEGVERVHSGAVDGEEGEDGGWNVVDPTLTEMKRTGVDAAEQGAEAEEGGTAASGSSAPLARRLPPTLRPPHPLPPLPVKDGQVPAILEITRSPAHISLAVIDPYDRLIVHLLARYYECLSWSEEHTSPTPTLPPIRLTHVIIPHLLRPKASHRTQVLTPETTDISGQSASEVEVDSDTTSEAGSDTTVGGSEKNGPSSRRANGYTVSGDELSAGEVDVDGYKFDSGDSASERSFSRDPRPGRANRVNGSEGADESDMEGEETFRVESTEDTALRARLARIALEDSQATRRSFHDGGASARQGEELYRIPSHVSVGSVGSSHYASSEASEFTTASSIGLGDSMTLPPRPQNAGLGAANGSGTGWQSSSMGLNGHAAANRANGAMAGQNLPLALQGIGQVKVRPSWEDRPTFFDYLYGS